jgi:Tfp pilus assembly protein PilN
MQALHLDFQRSGPGRRRLGVLLLMVGLVLTAAQLVRYRAIDTQVEDIQRQMAQLQREGTAAPGAMAADGRVRNSASVGRATAQWEAMFAALESSGDESVTLLGILPGTSEIQISGEARNLAAMMEYVSCLQSTPTFVNVYLTQSEIVVDHAQHPVRFSLAAPWPGGLP